MPPQVIIGTDADDTIDKHYPGRAKTPIDEDIDVRAGNDTIFGYKGRDTILGGLGDDWINAGADDDSASGDEGSDTIYGASGNDRITGDVVSAELVIFGDDVDGGDDQIYGGKGDDEIAGDQFNAYTYGADIHGSDDEISGGSGDDRIAGDQFRAFTLAGYVYGVGYYGGGNIDGGDDEIWGGDGDDVITGDHFYAAHSGGLYSAYSDLVGGDDYIDGGRGDDIIYGDALRADADVNHDNHGGNDVILGGDGADEIIGDQRDAFEIFDGGADWIDGGSGNDIICGDNMLGITSYGGAFVDGGNDVIYGGAGDDEIAGDQFNAYSDGGAVRGGDDEISGGDGDDKIAGDQFNADATSPLSGGDDNISGGDGNDIIAGDQFNADGGDIIAGDDTIDGGDGDDVIAGDQLYTYGESYSQFVGGDDTIDGGDGDDTIRSGGGYDVITGGSGNDIIVIKDLTFHRIDGGTGKDTLALAGARVALDITDETLAAKIEGIERIDLSGSGNNSLTIDQLAVFNETSESGNGVHVLTVEGNSGDAVTFTEAQWLKIGTFSDASGSFDRYVFGLAEVRVEQGLTVLFPGSFTGLIDLTTLSAAQGFIIQGDAAFDSAGYNDGSVSAAGDVNGDGFGDLIVGAPRGDDAGPFAGEAYVVFGKGSGFGATVSTGGFDRQVIDLTTLSAADGFIIQGDKAGDYAGYSVSTAGDVNGDGFDDLIVGAPLGDASGNYGGQAYVVFGKASGFGVTVNTDGFDRQVIDLTTLSAAEGFIIQGDTEGDRAGTSVSAAGDVNGDGFGDLIVGAYFGADGGTSAGEAYVVFGRASGFGTTVNTGAFDREVIDLTALSAADGFIIQGDTAHDFAGHSVSAAGDVNGDGFGDLIVGANSGHFGNSVAGEAYVVFGKASGFGATVTTDGFDRQVIDLTMLSAADGFVIQDDTAFDFAGSSVSEAGDVNGDGFGDLIVGAPLGDNGGNDAGEAYVVFGRASGFGTTVNTDGFDRQVIDLVTLSAAEGFIIQGDTAGDFAGSVSAAGDVNGDGFSDLIVGASGGDDGGINAGEAYVVFGKASGFGTTVNTGGFDRQVIDLTTLSVIEGFIIQGDTEGDRAGRSVSAAGDVNGDGFDDLIVGAPEGDDGGDSAGEAYVLFGGAFGASASPVTTTGSAADEIFIGALGDDTLTGGGGADVFHAGAGDDVLSVADLFFGLADGGTGNDTLVLLGSGASFDFTAFADNKTQSIEAIAFSGSGDNTLTLGLSDVLNMPDGRNFDFTGIESVPKSLVIDGNGGDIVNLEGDSRGAWTVAASDVNLDGTAGGAYDFWVFDTGAEDIAALAIKSDVNVFLI